MKTFIYILAAVLVLALRIGGFAYASTDLQIGKISPCNTCETDENGIFSCTLLYCPDAGNEITVSVDQCPQRMREVMKEADDFMQGRSGLAVYTDPTVGLRYTWKPLGDAKQRWDAVMKECVK